jgi:CMP-N-acetylneuraminic acid synthetase
MLKNFAGSNLLDVCLSKLLLSRLIPKDNLYLSCHDPSIKKIALDKGINIFPRSKESANEEIKMQVIYEWHDKINDLFNKNYKYAILISACNPLLKISTIDDFIKSFLLSEKKGAFSVFEKRNYFWDSSNNPTTDWKGMPVMNTKIVDPVYEGAHCLYATPLNLIKDGFFMDDKSPANPLLFCLDELESFDIDYPWQFEVAEIMYINSTVY